MADSPVASFLAEFGFAKPDAAGARAVEDLVNRTETRVTDVQAREGAKRAAAETKAQSEAVQRLGRWFAQRNEAEDKARDDRTKAAAEFMGDMLGLDREQTDKLLKSTKDGAAKSVEVEHLKAKKLSEIRGGQFKEASVDLLRFGAIAERVSGGLASALSIAPFGAFLTGIERSASGLARLDIQAKRTGSTAAGIQRFLFAMKQQGVDEGEATSALEGFASTMKSNPEGYRQALGRLGVKTTGPDGKPLGYDAMLENFGGYLAKQPFNIARMQAGQFGISGDNVVAALQDPAGTQRGLQAYDAKLQGFGLDPNKAAEDARKVQQSWDNLEADFKILKQKLDSEFFLPFMESLDAIARKMEQNPQAAASFGRGLEALTIGLSARVLPVLANLGVKLAGLGPVLGGSLGAALGIAVNPVVALGALAESTPTAPVTTDPAERARKLANNTLPAAEMTPEEREAFSKAHGGGLWNWVKSKLGIGDGGADGDRVKADIATIAESTKKLADKTEGSGGDGASGGFGQGGSGGSNLRYGHKGGGEGGGYRNTPGSPLKFAGFGNGGWEKSGANKQEVADYIRHAAAKAGIDPETAVRVARSEGLGTYVGDYGTSFGPFQLHYGGSGIRGMNSGGIGDRFTKETGLNARDPKTWREQVDFALKIAKREGWGAWHGAAHVGIGNRQGLDYHGPIPPAPAATKPTVTVNGTPSHPDAPMGASNPKDGVGDQAALDAQNRIVAGKGRPGDRALIDRHRQEQNAPVVSDRNPDGTIKLVLRTLGRYMKVTGPMFAKGELGHPHEIGPYHGPAHAPLDAARQKLADAMNAQAAQHLQAARHIAELAKGGKYDMAHIFRSHGPLGVSASMHAEINNGRTHNERHGDHFHIHGADAKSGLDHAVRVSARRGGQDRIRFGQASQQ